MKLKKRVKKHLDHLINRIGKKVFIDKNIYLVYSMGKVGSYSIYESLKKKKPFSDIFHVHFLSKNYLENLLPKGDEYFQLNIITGNRILEHIRANPNKRIKLITLVREPISRSISDLFQNWGHIYENIEEVSNESLKTYIASLNHEYTLNWFDDEFKEFLDFDIYEHSCDKEKGYSIYRHHRFDIICIKLECLNIVSDKAFKEFFGVNIPLLKANKSNNTKGYEKYQYLMKNVKIDEVSLGKVYSSKYVEHFYSSEEIRVFKQNWA